MFSFPGFGSLLIDSVQVLDVPLIEATVLLAAMVYIIANLVADVGAILLNPAPEEELARCRVWTTRAHELAW